MLESGKGPLTYGYFRNDLLNIVSTQSYVLLLSRILEEDFSFVYDVPNLFKMRNYADSNYLKGRTLLMRQLQTVLPEISGMKTVTAEDIYTESEYVDYEQYLMLHIGRLYYRYQNGLLESNHNIPGDCCGDCSKCSKFLEKYEFFCTDKKNCYSVDDNYDVDDYDDYDIETEWGALAFAVSELNCLSKYVYQYFYEPTTNEVPEPIQEVINHIVKHVCSDMITDVSYKAIAYTNADYLENESNGLCYYFRLSNVKPVFSFFEENPTHPLTMQFRKLVSLLEKQLLKLGCERSAWISSYSDVDITTENFVNHSYQYNFETHWFKENLVLYFGKEILADPDESRVFIENTVVFLLVLIIKFLLELREKEM